jgi:3-phenylpropionate/trans-cinnamate dioxygenase ferredoxin reductase subunit
MSGPGPVVVVGAGLAGARTAESLRAEGWDGPIVLLGAEPHRPYERPPLTKGYLSGGEDREKLFVHPEGWYADNGVDLRMSARAVRLDRAEREVVLEAAGRVRYGDVVLATGGAPRRQQLPGADLDGVLTLRTLDDSDRLRAAMQPGARVVVVGGGWIGLEAAASARSAGCDVTVLERERSPLLAVLGERVAGVLAELHRSRGVRLRCTVDVAGFAGADGTVTAVELRGGERVPADVVLVGVGTVAADDLARGAGLRTDNGVVVDEHLRTHDPRVLAVGDVASAYHPVLGHHLCVEHWANALHQPETAAKVITGSDAVHDAMPYFFSDQYDSALEYVGHHRFGDDLLVRSGAGGMALVACWLRDGQVMAGMHLNDFDAMPALKRLVGSRVDVDRLADPAVPLAQV